MRDTAGRAAAPAARCRNDLRGSFILVALIVTGDEGAHSGLMLAARITLPHFSVSAAMSFLKSAGERTSVVEPRSAIRAFTLGSARAALISLLSLSTISAGVFLGAPIPAQPLAS